MSSIQNQNTANWAPNLGINSLEINSYPALPPSPSARGLALEYGAKSGITVRVQGATQEATGGVIGYNSDSESVFFFSKETIIFFPSVLNKHSHMGPSSTTSSKYGLSKSGEPRRRTRRIAGEKPEHDEGALD